MNDPKLFAHTSPVYCYIGGRKISSREDGRVVVDWIDRLIQDVVASPRFANDRRRDEVVKLFQRGREYFQQQAQDKARGADTNMKHEMQPSRRSLLQTALAAPMSAAMKPPAASDLIEKENRKEGSDWQLTNVKLAGRNQFRTQLIEGYCSHQSIEAGQTLQIMVSTNPPGQFEIEIFRMGYYGGRGARESPSWVRSKERRSLIRTFSRVAFVSAGGSPAPKLRIPADWPSGVYLGRLTRLPERPTHMPGRVISSLSSASGAADILFQCSDNTWQAYNRWPDDYSMYTDPRHPWAPDVAASFDRPYGKYAQISIIPFRSVPESFFCGNSRFATGWKAGDTMSRIAPIRT